MKQKVVIKVSMEGNKSRSKALKIAVGASGVESASFKGDDKGQIEVTGDGLDAVVLTQMLRKKLGHADLVSVGPAGGEKKEDNKPKEVEAKPLVAWPTGAVPYYYDFQPARNPYSEQYNCSIM